MFTMCLSWLFVDMNAYFASVEQQLQPHLRGRPIAVAPVMTERTCCIAASYEAKRYGIRTGTNVGEARRLCPALEVVEARPACYVQFHHQIVAAVDSVLPVEEVCSIDEMACRLGNGQREVSQAVGLAHEVKRAVKVRAGEFICCSVGLAPNKFLAKIASDMQKPDGLTILSPKDIPDKLFTLELGDLTGIGRGMLRRLHQQGIESIQQLYELSRPDLGNAWNSIVGEQWWYLLRGYDLPTPRTHRRTLGHSHVLPPEFRTEEGARAILLRLIHKAAARLRQEDYWATCMTVWLTFLGDHPTWKSKTKMRPCQDTPTFVGVFADHWHSRPAGVVPLKAGVTFSKLIPTASTSRSLLVDDCRREEVAKTMDAINNKFGVDRLYLAAMHNARETAQARIAFRHIPDVKIEGGSM